MPLKVVEVNKDERTVGLSAFGDNSGNKVVHVPIDELEEVMDDERELHDEICAMWAEHTQDAAAMTPQQAAEATFEKLRKEMGAEGYEFDDFRELPQFQKLSAILEGGEYVIDEGEFIEKLQDEAYAKQFSKKLWKQAAQALAKVHSFQIRKSWNKLQTVANILKKYRSIPEQDRKAARSAVMGYLTGVTKGLDFTSAIPNVDMQQRKPVIEATVRKGAGEHSTSSYETRNASAKVNSSDTTDSILGKIYSKKM